MLRNNDTSLKELSLEKNKMGNAGITKVAAALLGNSVLTELNLKRNAIGNEGAAKVAQMLAGNSVQLLTRLYLEQNDIGGQGEYINEDHVSNSMLTDLRLAYNKIGDAGAVKSGGGAHGQYSPQEA